MRLFSGEATGLAVELPGWRYPVVYNLADGKVHLDNFNGHWGDQKHLDAFLQAYAVEQAKQEARARGTPSPSNCSRMDRSNSPCRLEAKPMKIAEIIISPAGQTRVETKGFTGGACREANRLLEVALGKITSDRLTAEFYQAEPNREENRQSA